MQGEGGLAGSVEAVEAGQGFWGYVTERVRWQQDKQASLQAPYTVLRDGEEWSWIYWKWHDTRYQLSGPVPTSTSTSPTARATSTSSEAQLREIGYGE